MIINLLQFWKLWLALSSLWLATSQPWSQRETTCFCCTRKLSSFSIYSLPTVTHSFPTRRATTTCTMISCEWDRSSTICSCYVSRLKFLLEFFVCLSFCVLKKWTSIFRRASGKSTWYDWSIKCRTSSRNLSIKDLGIFVLKLFFSVTKANFESLLAENRRLVHGQSRGLFDRAAGAWHSPIQLRVADLEARGRSRSIRALLGESWRDYFLF